MGFIAQYHGECAACGEELKGTDSRYNADGEVVHMRCPDTPSELGRNEKKCTKCFMIHAGEECP